jgi:uncharacterized protein YdaU (DUF1376 family)
MNFYKHYIGDFQRDTGHLSLTQRGAYLCLMHHYYATEKPLPNDHSALCRIAGALDKTERDAVRAVMSFFTPVDSGLMHKRIEAEIEKSGHVSDVNRDIALAREAKRRAAREAQTEHESSTKRAPIVQRGEDDQSTHHSQNQEYISKASPSHPLVWGFSEFWIAWPKNERKQDKAKCLDHWKRNNLSAIAEAISADVRVKRGTQKWQEGYIEAPLVYLRGKRWEDGVEPEPPKAAVETVVKETSDEYTARVAKEREAERARGIVPPPPKIVAMLRGQAKEAA